MKSIKRIPHKKIISIMLSVLLLFSITGIGAVYSNADGTIVYVKNDAIGTGDGTSWENAFRTLQEALDSVQPEQQIWVAKGIYYPTSTYTSDSSDPRNKHFRMENGVAIYGGFAGNETTEFNLAARDFSNNETVLSGNFAMTESTFDNSYQVIRNVEVNETAVLDGFTIRDARAASNPGGGMYNENSDPTLRNLIFTNNLANGGGMYNKSSSPALTNVTFHGNSAFRSGGGMYNESSSPNLINVTFDANTASRSGGGMYNENSNPQLNNVTFSRNETPSISTIDEGGGGMFNLNSSPVLNDVDFINNTARYFAGGMWNDNSSPSLTNVTFDGNSATEKEGGGMRNINNSNPILMDVVFSNNRAMATSGSGGGMNNSNSNPILTRVTFTDNEARALGGGMLNNGSSPILNDVVFNENEARNGGGMFSFDDSSSVLTDVKFIKNIASDAGGGMVSSDGTSPVLTNVTFKDNIAGDYGGGMFNSRGITPVLTNVVFTGNIAYSNGGAIYNTNASPILNNVTFSGHTIDSDDGVMYNRNNSNPVITNSIFAASEKKSSRADREIYNDTTSTASNPVISYSLIAGSGGSGIASWNTALGTDNGGNIDADPLFISETNLRLQAASPAIDAGTNAPFLSGGSAEGINTDLDGNPRIINDTVDMGAYEFGSQVPGPITFFYTVQFNVIDGNGSLAATVDGNSILTGQDIQEGKTIIFTASPDSGYQVKEWTLNGNTVQNNQTNSFTIQNLQDSATVTVEFREEVRHTVTFSVYGENGSVSAMVDGFTINSGDAILQHKDIVFTAIPNSGYQVREWKLNESIVEIGGNPLKDNTFTLNNLQANADVKVAFEVETPKFSLTMNVTGNGLTTPAAGTSRFEVDEVVRLTAVPASGWSFTNWNINSVTVTESVYDLQMTDNKIVTANFAAVPSSGGGGGGGGSTSSSTSYTLTVSTEGEGTTTPTAGTHNYQQGTAVTLTASPAEGWEFVSWVVNGQENLNQTTQVTMDGNRQAAALFAETSVLVPELETPLASQEEPFTILLTIDSKELWVNNHRLVMMDVAPFINPNANRTMVPIRFVSEQLGAEVDWLENTRQVRITLGEKVILLTIDSNIVMVNGAQVEIESSAKIVDSRTFVPLRFISETLGASVSWDGDARQVTIISARPVD